MTDSETVYTTCQVSQHNSPTDLWIIISGNVYNVTEFASLHPGGKRVLEKVAGKDATEQFNNFHNASVIKKYSKYKIGTVSDAQQEKDSDIQEFPNVFGDGVPFGDPYWYQSFNSPYYTESHKQLRSWMRQFVDTQLMPYCHEWDESGKFVPRSVFEACGKSGILTAVCGAPWPIQDVPSDILPPGHVLPNEFDSFHEFIVKDELSRAASGGTLWGLMGGHTIALPPIIHFGSQFIKNKVVGDCLSGKKVICLAVTEPYAGSDVANIKTEAVKSKDGKYYIVNGEKKWITNAIFADYYLVVVRTGGEGMNGISLLLLEKGMPGITLRKMKCSGVWASGTTFITFENVKVPVENLVGPENKGFKCVMINFNQERMGIAIQATRFARVCLEESITYGQKRETFGKKLIQHPVIRNKLAHMARKVEATYAWMEVLLYQMKTLDPKEAQIRLGGPIALLKAQATQTFEYCAREAAQIFGGLAYTRGGVGEKVERLYREVRAYAIPGGSEEIMLDLGIRQSMRVAELSKEMSKLSKL